MKKTPVVAAGCCLLVCFLSASAFGAAGAGPKARLFAKYDANRNGVIDGDEIAALRQDFAAEPKGGLARYDTNHDGKLSDEEIAAIKPPGKSGRSEGKKGEKKSDGKKQKTPPPEGKAPPENAEKPGQPAGADSN